MPVVVGVSLRTAGKVYYFNPGDNAYHFGERVLVETARGLEMGTVKIPPQEVPEEQIVPPLKNVLRSATSADLQRDAQNRQREATALDACKRHIARLNLPMRLIDAQYTFDGSHVLINFLAENRVDFRELVRDLARELHIRIELRQVGVRDEAKLLGGYGMCGRPLCCATFMNNFAPVAINMAKVQGLALNPQKISGSCGRLMCCLAFEYEHYNNLRIAMPRLNATIATPRGTGKVTKINVLAGQVEVAIPEEPAPLWFSAEELGFPTQAAPCCASTGAGCGRCGASEESDADYPAATCEETGFATLDDERPGPTRPTPMRARPDEPLPEESASAAGQERRRPRRRRGGKPAPAAAASEPGNGKKEGNAAPPRQSGKPVKSEQSPAQKKPKRAKASLPVAAPAAGEGGPAALPSGRYRPRRRRGGNAGGDNAPPAS